MLAVTSRITLLTARADAGRHWRERTRALAVASIIAIGAATIKSGAGGL